MSTISTSHIVRVTAGETFSLPSPSFFPPWLYHRSPHTLGQFSYFSSWPRLHLLRFYVLFLLACITFQQLWQKNLAFHFRNCMIVPICSSVSTFRILAGFAGLNDYCLDVLDKEDSEWQTVQTGNEKWRSRPVAAVIGFFELVRVWTCTRGQRSLLPPKEWAEGWGFDLLWSW